MKTRWTVPGLGLLLIVAVNCGKDDPLPGPPDAATKDGGASDAVKPDVEISVDLSPVGDAAVPDIDSASPDTAPADTGGPGVGDTPVTPIVADAKTADSATDSVHLDGGSAARETRPADLAVPQVDAQPDGVAQDAPEADALDLDGGTEG